MLWIVRFGERCHQLFEATEGFRETVACVQEAKKEMSKTYSPRQPVRQKYFELFRQRF